MEAAGATVSPEDMEVSQLLLLREATVDDKNFILNSWVKSYRKRGSEAKALKGLVYFEHHPKLVQRLIERSFILVACDKNCPEVVWAFVVFEVLPGSIVFHFAYTKSPLRRRGLMRRMLLAIGRDSPPDAEPSHSHETDIGRVLAAKYRSTFNPYLR